MKRVVRQRCGFGCVICGLPIYQYEHMEGYANVRRHVAEEITLLCSRHHEDRTKGLLPIEAVRKADLSPFNRNNPKSSAYQMHYAGDLCTVNIGSNRFTSRLGPAQSSLTAIAIDNEPLVGFSLRDEQLMLNMRVHDENNVPILEVVENQLTHQTSQAVWDIEFVGQTLTIREGKGRFLFEVTFQPPNSITIGRSRLMFNGVEVVVQPNYLLLVNNQCLFSSNTTLGADCGLAIESPRYRRACVAIGGVPRHDLGEYDPKRRSEAIAWANTKMSTMPSPRPRSAQPVSSLPMRTLSPPTMPGESTIRDAIARFHVTEALRHGGANGEPSSATLKGMAKRVVTELIDDIDGKPADETVSLSLDGKAYQIDLRTKNAKALRKALAPYVDVARKVPGSRTARDATNATDASEVRAWAKRHGHEVPDRGRIPSAVRAAYEAAH
jgi:hypothetical protein